MGWPQLLVRRWANIVKVGLVLAFIWVSIAPFAQARTFARRTDFRIGMRLLVLSSDASLADVPRDMCMAYGVPCDIVQLTRERRIQTPDGGVVVQTVPGDVNLTLVDADGNPRYYGIVFTHSRLGYLTTDENGYEVWQPSIVSQAQLNAFRAYARDFGVRVVYLRSEVNGDAAVVTSMGPGQPSGTLEDFELRFMDNEIMQEIKSNVRIDSNLIYVTDTIVDPKYQLIPSGSMFTTPVAVNESSNADGHIKPFLQITYKNPGIPPGIAGLINETAECEEMHFYVPSTMNGLHGQVLADVWLTWVTRGIFIGQRRILLDTQIDDVYLDTAVYNVTLNRQALDSEGEPPFTYRTTSDDLLFTRDHMNEIRSRMGAGSNFTIQLAFNGRGYGDFGANPYYMPNLNPETLRLRDDFLWVTHTWNHIDMYCVLSDCRPQMPPYMDPNLLQCHRYTETNTCVYPFDPENGREPKYPESGYTPYEYLVYEITKNQWFTNRTLFANKTDGTTLSASERESWPTWSAHSIVTPRISGLNYSEAIRAMLEAGIYSAVGDNSRADLKPANVFHGFQATAKVGRGGQTEAEGFDAAAFNTEMRTLYGRESVFVMPRFATRVYFDVSLPSEAEAEFNSFYGPRCFGYNETGPIVPYGRKCNTTSYKFSVDFAVYDIMTLEAFETARNLLAYNPNAYMFHQANLRAFQYNGKRASLLSMWLDRVYDLVGRLNTLPVLTYKMDDMERLYRARMARDECGLDGWITYVDGEPVFVDVTAKSECVAKVTLTPTRGHGDYVVVKTPRAVTGERYGVDRTYSLPFSLARNTSRLALIGAPKDVSVEPSAAESSSDALSVAEIVGISLAAAAASVLIVGLVAFVVFRWRKRSRGTSTDKDRSVAAA